MDNHGPRPAGKEPAAALQQRELAGETGNLSPADGFFRPMRPIYMWAVCVHAENRPRGRFFPLQREASCGDGPRRIPSRTGCRMPRNVR